MASLLVIVALAIPGIAQASARKDVETVMNAFMPIATQMLARHGGFSPYGGAMTAEGKIVRVSSYDRNKNPKSGTAIKRLREAFRAGANAGMYQATGLFYNVQVKRPDTGARTDAIAVALDHRDGDSTIVLFPYTVEKGRVKLGPAFSTPGLKAVFSK